MRPRPRRALPARHRPRGRSGSGRESRRWRRRRALRGGTNCASEILLRSRSGRKLCPAVKWISSAERAFAFTALVPEATVQQIERARYAVPLYGGHMRRLLVLTLALGATSCGDDSSGPDDA